MSRSLAVLLLMFLSVANMVCVVVMVCLGVWPVALLNAVGAAYALHTLSNME